MPPQIQALLNDKRMLGIVAGVLLLVLGLLVWLGMSQGGPKEPGDQPIAKEQMSLAMVNSAGKAIEIQALLARHGIHLNQEGDGDKITLTFEKGAKQKERDLALITLVQSGLMDKNVGLEAFDKGDLTASREEKRIKLIRSQQGEIARLIKKIDPIEDASVNIAIPEQTLFRSEEKPISATVQVSLPSGTRLSREKVRAVTNLIVGSIQGLEASHVTVSDTNGNTYSSVLDSNMELNDKLEEQDNYMKQKVATQLDRLVGPGNYVVTVSTELRQAPKETMTQEFDPQGAVISSKQSFNENLNSNGTGPGAGGPTSSFLPNSLSTTIMGNSNRKDYLRNGVEVSYNNSKTQWIENRPVGMIEDISIAVTIDSEHYPSGMNLQELQTLLAKAASPKVNADNVRIAKSNMQKMKPVSSLEGSSSSAGSGDFTWIFWAGGAVLVCIFVLILLSAQKGGGSVPPETITRTQQELQQLREFAHQQQAQLQATQQQTQMLLEAQQRQFEQVQALQNPVMQEQRQIANQGGLQEVLQELKTTVETQDIEADDFNLQIKNWIESS